MMTRSFNSTVASLATAVWISILAVGPAQAQSDRIEELFDELQQVEPERVMRIEEQIWTEWSKSGSPAMDLLLRRGEEALEAGKPELAADHLTALIDHAPDFAEGYHARATAYYGLGLIGPALDDLRQTLVLEPRHFGAMAGFAVILEEVGRPEDALAVWREVEKITPNNPDVRMQLERLELELEGRAL